MRRAGLATAAAAPPPELEATFPPIEAAAVLAHTRILASDEYEGRLPGSKGEELTVAYLTDQLKQAGIKPGNPDGTYVQKVPLVGITVQADAGAHLPARAADGTRSSGATTTWPGPSAWSTRSASTSRSWCSSGYGVQAPEFNWDDYKGVDLKGKTMVVLVGDPPVPDPANPVELDPKTFGGRAMTYYGRWTYKYEMGAKMGAAGVLIVHETGPAGYPFAVVQGKTAEQFDLVTPDKNMGRAAVEGWITLDQAKQLFAGGRPGLRRAQEAGGDARVQAGRRSARRRRSPSPTRSGRSTRTTWSGSSKGSDPTLKDEYVIYTAHWDHFGIGVPGERRQDLQRRAGQRRRRAPA